MHPTSKNCCGPILFLLMPVLSVISAAVTAGKDLPAPQKPSLLCAVSTHGSSNAEATLTCTIGNSCTTDIFVLTSPLTLEGPRSDQSLPRRHTSGDRYENVFEYDRGVVNLQHEGVIFDPWVIPTPEEMSAMLRVAEGQTVSFTVSWSPGSDSLPAATEMWWTIRIKLVYLAESRLNSLRDDEQLIATCPGIPFKKIEAELRPWSAPVSFMTRKWKEGRGYEAGLCDDALSLVFDHLYSNQMSFNINVEAPE